ncbi:MAG: chemotaxis protein CheW, partial [Burkholderiales bacterium]|nr:chemotaxis protein CheW [Burkholderiales bacterium]
LVGELVITQAMLAQNSRELDPALYQQLTSGLADLERNTRDLQESVMSIRMIPMSTVFNRFPRMLRDLAAKLGKKVELVTQGEATELDKSLVEKITDPLTHLVRNSCDHGIEMPEDRVARGKSEQGTITLVASHQGGSIVIEVRDDGRGLNREKLIKKAREKGIDAPDSMTDAECWSLIFAPGFSTADVVTDVSGRGVGMDVVKKNITSLGGTVEIDSAEGYGMKVSVRLPLTLAIMDGMSVGVGEECYILPLSSVVESFQVQSNTIKTVAGSGRVVEVRDEYMPVIELEKVFEVPRFDFEHVSSIMVVVEAEGGRVALLVDELLGQQQVVVKNLEANYRKVNDGEYLTFRLGSEEYGIDILKVQEIRSYEPPTRIANAPAFIKGVVNLRGVIVPIVDLRLKLNCPSAEYNSFTVVIVLNVKNRVVGAVVDSVSDVLELSRDAIKPAPELSAASVDTSFITGIGSVGDRMLILMDIEGLMSSAEMGLMDAAVAA